MNRVRKYKDTDKELLRALVIESNLYQKKQLEREQVNEESVKENTSEIFESILKHEDQQYFVAEADDQLVGFILVEVSPMYAFRGSVDDLYILEAFRNQGIGKELLQQALPWLKEKGAKKVGLAVHKSNEVAIHLYKEAGFIEEPETYLSLEKNL